jgi:large subunit ribosomal protein L17
MHRNGYKGRKFSRERDQRRALMKGLASNFVEHEGIVTTISKAKELVPYMEKLITKAKIGDLHNRRQVISKMANVESGHKLVDEIAPKLTARNSGHLRIKREGTGRRGDNVQMARVSFVDDLSAPAPKAVAKKVEDKPEAKKTVAKAAVKPVAAKKAPAKKPVAKKETK